MLLLILRGSDVGLLTLLICTFEQEGEESQRCRASRRPMKRSGIKTLKMPATKNARGCRGLNDTQDGG